ncbi:hypothetical protein Trydic_g16101 [Trypoxylus dichotomus]
MENTISKESISPSLRNICASEIVSPDKRRVLDVSGLELITASRAPPAEKVHGSYLYLPSAIALIEFQIRFPYTI